MHLPAIAPGGRTLNMRLADPSPSSPASWSSGSPSVDLLFQLAPVMQNASTITIHVVATRASSNSVRSARAAAYAPDALTGPGQQRAREPHVRPVRQQEFASGGGGLQGSGTSTIRREATVSVGGARPTRLGWALPPPLGAWRLAITNRDPRRAADLLLTVLSSGTFCTTAVFWYILHYCSRFSLPPRPVLLKTPTEFCS